VHPPALRHEARALIAAGVSDSVIGRHLGLPRATVRFLRVRPPPLICPRCWRRSPLLTFTAADYAELLGLYLGDGHIAQLARTQKLRLSLDARYEQIVADADALLRRCFPGNRVGRVLADRGATVVLHVHHAHLACLFPQHGPGKKHHRRILLEDWQQSLVAAEPWALLRGLIRSDGCVFVNRTRRYEYLSFHFTNLSEDILDLFVATCESLGLRPRRTVRYVRLNRREDVARLLVDVGRKK
jgi:hypothetical protein